MDYNEKHLRTINRYEGVVVGVRVDNVLLSNGSRTLREVVEHPGGVTVLPVDDEGYAYCVRQYRYPFGEVLLEAPAGKLEKGEEHYVCAIRELSEETGIKAGKIDYLGAMYASPGFCDEVLHLYLARELEFGESHPDTDELLSVERIHLSELERLVMEGKIKDAKTEIVVLKAKRILEG